MTGIRMPDIELTDKCRSELDEFKIIKISMKNEDEFDKVVDKVE
jgi:hypothetical protein